MEREDKVTENLELFYDVFSESCNYLYEITKANYFELFLMTAKNIIAGEVVLDLEYEDIKKLDEIYAPLVDKEFSTEDVRKAIQSQVLRALKETRNTNGMTTPDTFGLLISYLIGKLYPNKRQISILDPFVGSGNLLYTIWNHTDKETILFGCDNDEGMIKIASAFADMLTCDISLYLQDTLSLKISNLDLITFDFPITFKMEPYFPYECISKYLSMLNENGYIIGLLPEDFLSHDKGGKFKEEFRRDASIIGIIELPDSFFISNKKNIVIIKNKPLENNKCFMIKLDNFTDPKAFNEQLLKIENWFAENKKILDL